MTRIPSRAEVAGAVAISGVAGSWPSSPSAQRGDSGVWRAVLALIKSGPPGGTFGNAYRPGDPKWHGSGRAVDWMGFNQDALAAYLAAHRPLELIHRTKTRDYAYTRGVNKGSFNNTLMEQHRNHIHMALAAGGAVGRDGQRLPLGVYDSGGALPTGLSLAYNGTGRPEVIPHPDSPYGNVTVDAQVRVFVGSREITDIARVEVDSALRQTARDIRNGTRV